MSSVGVDSVINASPDGEKYSVTFPTSLTRTFSLDSSTLTFNTADLEVYDKYGKLLDGTTSPFSWDGETLTFQSESSEDEGVHKFKSLGVSFLVGDYSLESVAAVEVVLAPQEEELAEGLSVRDFDATETVENFFGIEVPTTGESGFNFSPAVEQIAQAILLATGSAPQSYQAPAVPNNLG